MVAKLTSEASAGKPPMPISLNPDHVVELKPRFRPTPNQGSQSGGLVPNFKGSTALLVTGERLNILEDYGDAHEKLWPGVGAKNIAEGVVPLSSIPQANLSGLTDVLSNQAAEPEEFVAEPAAEPVAEAEPAPEPPKKTSGKKVAPRAEAKADEEKDED